MAFKTWTNPPEVPPQRSWTEDWRRADIGAANGHGNARSLARLQSAVACGGEVDGIRLLAPQTIARIFEVQSDWIDQRENVLLVGASGAGKTHLATGLALAACLQGRKARFFRVTQLIALLLEARDDKQLLKLRSQLAKLDLVVLDELGYVPASKAGAELLFDVTRHGLRTPQPDRNF